MSTSTFEASLRAAIIQRYREKYGEVQIYFDVIDPTGEHTAQVQFTLSDRRGFITRYYGQATSQAGQLHLNVRSI